MSKENKKIFPYGKNGQITNCTILQNKYSEFDVSDIFVYRNVFVNEAYYKKEIRQTLLTELLEELEGLLENHICRFNDGECECDCYKEAQSDIKAIIESKLKEE